MRADDGERQLTVSGDMHSLLFPLSYLLLHSNRLTNVPWKFTLDAGSGRSKRNEAAAERTLECDVAAMRTLFFFFNPEMLLTIYSYSPLRQSETLFKMWRFRCSPRHLLHSYFVFLFLKLHEHLFYSWFSPTILS